MDGPRDYHSKWTKSEKDKYHLISLICGILKKRYKWTSLQDRFRDFENQLWLPKGTVHGEDGLGDWDGHMHTAVYGITDQQGPDV